MREGIYFILSPSEHTLIFQGAVEGMGWTVFCMFLKQLRVTVTFVTCIRETPVQLPWPLAPPLGHSIPFSVRIWTQCPEGVYFSICGREGTLCVPWPPTPVTVSAASTDAHVNHL